MKGTLSKRFRKTKSGKATGAKEDAADGGDDDDEEEEGDMDNI